MGLFNGLVGGTGTAQNLAAKWKEKRASGKFNKKYKGLKGEPSKDYLAGYSSIGDDSASYQGQPNRVSYALTDSYPNLDQGFDVRTIARTFWDNEENTALQQIFLGIDDRYFRYGFEYGSDYSDNNYEDPTFLGFEVIVDGNNSPLFDFMKKTPIITAKPRPSRDLIIPPKVVFGEKMPDIHSVIEVFNDDALDVYTEQKDKAGNQGYITITLDGVPVCGPNLDIKNSIELCDLDSVTYNKIFNQKQENNPANIPPSTQQPLPPVGSASYFLTKYQNTDISDTGNRLSLLKEFQELFLQIIPNSFVEAGKPRRTYYIQNIRGLEILPKKIPEYKKDKITFTLCEDIGLRITYLAELYNNIAYSYKYQRLAVPENCLRFDMIIKISDKRTFNLPKSEEELNNIEANNTRDLFKTAENAYIIYTLHDCLLDFQMSQPHGQQVQMGGYVAAEQTPASLEFNVFYKSVSKTFQSKLIGPINQDRVGTYTITNKGNDLIEDTTKFTPNIQFQSPNREDIVNKKIKKSDPLAGTGFANRLSSSLFGDGNVNGGVFQQVGDRLFNAAVNAVDNMFDAAIQEGRKIRGELIDKLTKKITGGDFVIEIFPANVYDGNLDEVAGDGLSNMTLQNQLSNFQLDLFSQGRNIVGNALNDLTSF